MRNRTNPHHTRSGRDINLLRKQVEEARRNPVVFPKGHTVAIAYAMVFGPRNAKTPAGHPITITSGLFDLAVETPQHAIARAAKHWMGIEIHEPHWEIEFEADVKIADDHPIKPKVVYQKVFHLRYLHEAHKYSQHGLDYSSIHNHFRESWYLSILDKPTVPVTVSKS
jgi:hypothetical protein